MNKDLVAHAAVVIDAPARRVWNALVDPELIRQYMFGSQVISEWREGSAITWKGEWQGRPYEDKGVILRIEPEKLIRYTHYSPLSGLEDKAENYHTVTIELSADDRQTRVTLAQDHNATEEARAHSEKNWGTMLAGLKKLFEQ